MLDLSPSITLDEEIVKHIGPSALRRELYTVIVDERCNIADFMIPNPNLDLFSPMAATARVGRARLRTFVYSKDVALSYPGSVRQNVESAVQEAIYSVSHAAAKKLYDDLAAQVLGVQTDVTSLEQNFYDTVLQAYADNYTNIEWMIVLHPATFFKVINAWYNSLRDITQYGTKDWLCKYCGTIQNQSLFSCWDGVFGCGAPRPEIDADYLCLFCGRTYGKETIICWDGVDGCGAVEGIIKLDKMPGLRDVVQGREDIQTWALKNKKLFVKGYMMDVVVDTCAPQDQVFMLPKEAMGITGLGLFRKPTVVTRVASMPSYVFDLNVYLSESFFLRFPQISRRFDL